MAIASASPRRYLQSSTLGISRFRRCCLGEESCPSGHRRPRFLGAQPAAPSKECPMRNPRYLPWWVAVVARAVQRKRWVRPPVPLTPGRVPVMLPAVHVLARCPTCHRKNVVLRSNRTRRLVAGPLRGPPFGGRAYEHPLRRGPNRPPFEVLCLVHQHHVVAAAESGSAESGALASVPRFRMSSRSAGVPPFRPCLPATR